ncbi:thioredoxin family protein, partial [Nocardia sp. NPDC004582]
MIALGILAAMLVAAVAVGLLLRRNEGRVRERAAAPRPLEPESQRAGLVEGRTGWADGGRTAGWAAERCGAREVF